MKGKLLIVGVVTLAFIGFITVKLLVDMFGKREGRIRVVTNQDAVVFIDNVMKGKTPFENTVKEGTFMLKIIPEQVATDSAVTWEKRVTVSKDTLTFIDVRLAKSDIASSAEMYWLIPRGGLGVKPARMMVESEPSGALVYVDNDEKGISPITIDSVPEGSHELAVFMPGFVRKIKKINIVNGTDLHAFIKIPVDPSQAPKYTPSSEIVATAAAALTPPKNTVRILDTPTGWLRVREEPTLNASESGRVNPGQVFEVVEEQEGWYKIKIDQTKQGWISSQFSVKN